MRLFRFRSLILLAALLAACATPSFAQQRTSRIGQLQSLPRKTPGQQAVGGQHLPAGGDQYASNEPNRRFDEEIDKHFAEKKLPGLVVLYARDGMLVYKRVKGKADVEGNVAMTEHKISRLNSVSKWVGTIAQLKLEEQGLIDLKSKAKSHLSDLPDHHQYRVIDLLACRSGVRHYGGTTSPESPQNWSENDYAKATDAIANFWHDPLADITGEYHYSTFGYSIADACAEQASGKSFKQLVKNLVGNPAGASTLAVEDLDANQPQRVKYYTVKNGQNVAVTPLKKEWCPSGGGMESSPIDLLKVGMALVDGKLLSQKNVHRMMTRVNPAESYALGCSHAVENGYQVMAKSGSEEGSNAYIWLVPERRMVMVVMANRDDAGVSGLGGTLRSIALGKDKAVGELPDLIVEQFERTGPVQHRNGHVEIPVRFVVRNNGQAGVNEKFVNSIRVEASERYTGFLDPLPRSASKQVTTVIKIPDANKLLAGRKLMLSAYADAPVTAADTSLPKHARVKEENENNNGKVLEVSVPGGLDLKADRPAPARVPQAQRPTRVVKEATPAAPVRQPKRIGNVNK